MRGLFVTGTDTGVGKTVLSAALLASMSVGGEAVRAHKPMLTGLDEAPGEGWPRDHELLGAMCGMTPTEVTPLCFRAPASPHLAAAMEGAALDPAELLSNARAAAPSEGALLVEGVGGLLVPLTADYTVRDLADDLGLPLVIAARPGLGTINHTLLTLEAARGHGLTVAAVVLNPWPTDPGELEQSNRETIARLGEVEVHGLPRLAGAERTSLAVAGDGLPWREWLAASGPAGL